jgi:uncharacterized protein YegL
MKNNSTLYHFVIDRSGSMSGMEQEVVSGFNSQVETIKKLQTELAEQHFLMSLTIFDSEVENLVLPTPIKEITQINTEQFKPRGMTALLDAIGKSIAQIEFSYGEVLKENLMSVVMVIITDGQENASAYFNYHEIAKQIAARDAKDNWTFNFIGCDFDAIHTSRMLNIKRENVMNMNKEDYQHVSQKVSQSMSYYAKEKRSGKFVKNLFHNFKEDENL